MVQKLVNCRASYFLSHLLVFDGTRFNSNEYAFYLSFIFHRSFVNKRMREMSINGYFTERFVSHLIGFTATHDQALFIEMQFCNC